jgi:hypothetical protein
MSLEVLMIFNTINLEENLTNIHLEVLEILPLYLNKKSMNYSQEWILIINLSKDYLNISQKQTYSLRKPFLLNKHSPVLILPLIILMGPSLEYKVNLNLSSSPIWSWLLRIKVYHTSKMKPTKDPKSMEIFTFSLP